MSITAYAQTAAADTLFDLHDGEAVIARNVLARCSHCDHDLDVKDGQTIDGRNSFGAVWYSRDDVWALSHNDADACDALAQS